MDEEVLIEKCTRVYLQQNNKQAIEQKFFDHIYSEYCSFDVLTYVTQIVARQIWEILKPIIAGYILLKLTKHEFEEDLQDKINENKKEIEKLKPKIKELIEFDSIDDVLEKRTAFGYKEVLKKMLEDENYRKSTAEEGRQYIELLDEVLKEKKFSEEMRKIIDEELSKD